MVKFVWLEGAGGVRHAINPDQVRHLRPLAGATTAVVLGAVTGGLHELVVRGPVQDVAAQLEAGPPPAAGVAPAPAAAAPDPPQRPSGKHRRP